MSGSAKTSSSVSESMSSHYHSSHHSSGGESIPSESSSSESSSSGPCTCPDGLSGSYTVSFNVPYGTAHYPYSGTVTGNCTTGWSGSASAVHSGEPFSPFPCYINFNLGQCRWVVGIVSGGATETYKTGPTPVGSYPDFPVFGGSSTNLYTDVIVS